jgi:biotin operon repressor
VKTVKKTKLDLLLSVLADFDWHWGDELAVKVSLSFNATIKEARNKGYEIKTERVGVPSRYRLVRF